MPGKVATPGLRLLLSNIPLPEQNLLGIAAGAALQRLVPIRLSRVTGRRQRLLRTTGGASLAAGGVLVTWSWWAAHRTLLTRPAGLVTSGPYSFSRNPMYVGWTLLHLGIGLVWHNAWTLAALPVAAAAVHRRVLREEASLAASFGGAFAEYRRAVPRYVGRRCVGRRCVGRRCVGRRCVGRRCVGMHSVGFRRL
ncbi:isoprenylcysteine carboxylmethyltransferase family protein [Arthrobacter sp. OY3WO11]|uniref:methyltransferase family protein n=1 Tax=Arthrobacter sp. OY3WO11 TaxID=1835723 RepID=UPI000AD38424|nr:isoprenylcysteine carboxylmethyltransferase family protein [Arthrobacter sp. OY3WO11]